MSSLMLPSQKPVTLARKVHRLVGVALSLCVTVLAVTGLILIHQKEWTWLKAIEVPPALIPHWAATAMAQKGGQVKALALQRTSDSVSPDVLVGTKAGLYAWRDGRWTSVPSLPNQLEVTALLLMKSRWLIGTQQGLYTSTDAGETWTPHPGPDGTAMGKITTLQRNGHGSTTLYAGSKTGAYASTDGGEHWRSLAGESGAAAGLRTEISSIAIDPERPDHVFFGTKHGIYRYHSGTGAVETIAFAPLQILLAAQPTPMALDAYLNDLHTGKLFGDKLWSLYDLTAIGLVLFVGTGVYMWIYPKLRRRQLGFGRTGLHSASSSPHGTAAVKSAKLAEG